MNLLNMKLPAQLEELARWLAEDGEEEDALESYLSTRGSILCATVPAAATPISHNFAPPPPHSTPQRFEVIAPAEKKTDLSLCTPKSRKGLRTLVRAACGVVASLLVLAIALITLPRLFGVEWFVQYNNNMQPRFAHGAVVVYRNTPFADIPLNADIVFVNDNTLVLSRVVGRNSTQQIFTTRDLANSHDNPLVFADSVRGQVLFGIPVLGYAIHHLHSTTVQLIVAGVLFMLGIALFMLGRKMKHSAAKEIAELDDILSDDFFANLNLA